VEIIIGSDGSKDKTDDIIEHFQNPKIKLITKDIQRGKIAMLNEIVVYAKNDILVFTDARQEFAQDALRALVKNFTDPTVGCVSGELILAKEEGATAKGINLYWNYEKFIRNAESQIHSMLGATGAIYAIRRELYSPAPKDTILDDMFIPLKIIQKGYRAIFDGNAKAFDRPANSPREEYRRKARTLYGNYQIFRMFLGLFNPFKSPIALQLFSHKFLRVVVPFFLIAVFIINFFLRQDNLYARIFSLQVIFYLMAFIGILSRHQKCGILGLVSRMCYIPYVFCLLNFSALIGFFRFVGSRQEVTWSKARVG
jgi:cellulose synthase/poly-beta-1,6-N-acetylglucosamine synthase-like glycosyltransferase